jgi:hypothetical protein
MVCYPLAACLQRWADAVRATLFIAGTATKAGATGTFNARGDLDATESQPITLGRQCLRGHAVKAPVERPQQKPEKRKIIPALKTNRLSRKHFNAAV